MRVEDQRSRTRARRIIGSKTHGLFERKRLLYAAPDRKANESLILRLNTYASELGLFRQVE